VLSLSHMLNRIEHLNFEHGQERRAYPSMSRARGARGASWRRARSCGGRTRAAAPGASRPTGGPRSRPDHPRLRRRRQRSGPAWRASLHAGWAAVPASCPCASSLSSLSPSPSWDSPVSCQGFWMARVASCACSRRPRRSASAPASYLGFRLGGGCEGLSSATSCGV
jgi:hypothetical protein